MNMKPLIMRNLAMMIVFGSVGLTMFTENVRTVQIVGLMATGAVVGAAFASIIFALKAKQPRAEN